MTEDTKKYAAVYFGHPEAPNTVTKTMTLLECKDYIEKFWLGRRFTKSEWVDLSFNVALKMGNAYIQIVNSPVAD